MLAIAILLICLSVCLNAYLYVCLQRQRRALQAEPATEVGAAVSPDSEMNVQINTTTSDRPPCSRAKRRALRGGTKKYNVNHNETARFPSPPPSPPILMSSIPQQAPATSAFMIGVQNVTGASLAVVVEVPDARSTLSDQEALQLVLLTLLSEAECAPAQKLIHWWSVGPRDAYDA